MGWRREGRVCLVRGKLESKDGEGRNGETMENCDDCGEFYDRGRVYGSEERKG